MSDWIRKADAKVEEYFANVDDEELDAALERARSEDGGYREGQSIIEMHEKHDTRLGKQRVQAYRKISSMSGRPVRARSFTEGSQRKDVSRHVEWNSCSPRRTAVDDYSYAMAA